MSVRRYEPALLNDICESTLLIPNVCRQAPLPASQILTVSSLDADASRVESWEKATELTQPPWPSSVCRQAPLPASQILTVPSYDVDASRVESCEKATDLTELPWPASVCRQAPIPLS
jgi:hypothetical protein